MLKKNKLRLGVVAAVTIAAVAFGAAPAIADPAAGAYKSLNGAGSDTTQDVVNGLTTVVSSLGSYDATGTATIKTTSTGVTFNRPNGSTAGVQALSAASSIDTGTHLWAGADITGQLDFARSSSGASSSFPGSALTFIPFARDAVTFAVNAASDFPRDIPIGSSGNTTEMSLRNIYNCTYTRYTDGEGNAVTIRPLVPQAGSGTRTFWQSALGLTAFGPCVTDLNGVVQEHNGAAVTGAGDIVPFSIAQFVAQGNHGLLPTTVAERRSQVELGSIGSIKPVLLKSTGVELNGSFPVNRLVYNVVETARLGESAIASAFVGSGSGICSAASTIRAYGFATIANCGATTVTQGYRY